jgi:hypothetical protein
MFDVEKRNNLPVSAGSCRRRSMTVVDTVDSFADAAGELGAASRNYAESLKVSSQRSLIRSHEKLKETIENSTLSERMLREILGADYYRYRE